MPIIQILLNLLIRFNIFFSNNKVDMEGELHPLVGIPSCAISPKGVFKYILIYAEIKCDGKVYDANFVRGY